MSSMLVHCRRCFNPVRYRRRLLFLSYAWIVACLTIMTVLFSGDTLESNRRIDHDGSDPVVEDRYNAYVHRRLDRRPQDRRPQSHDRRPQSHDDDDDGDEEQREDQIEEINAELPLPGRSERHRNDNRKTYDRLTVNDAGSPLNRHSTGDNDVSTDPPRRPPQVRFSSSRAESNFVDRPIDTGEYSIVRDATATGYDVRSREEVVGRTDAARCTTESRCRSSGGDPSPERNSTTSSIQNPEQRRVSAGVNAKKRSESERTLRLQMLRGSSGGLNTDLRQSKELRHVMAIIRKPNVRRTGFRPSVLQLSDVLQPARRQSDVRPAAGRTSEKLRDDSNALRVARDEERRRTTDFQDFLVKDLADEGLVTYDKSKLHPNDVDVSFASNDLDDDDEERVAVVTPPPIETQIPLRSVDAAAASAVVSPYTTDVDGQSAPATQIQMPNPLTPSRSASVNAWSSDGTALVEDDVFWTPEVENFIPQGERFDTFPVVEGFQRYMCSATLCVLRRPDTDIRLLTYLRLLESNMANVNLQGV